MPLSNPINIVLSSEGTNYSVSSERSVLLIAEDYNLVASQFDGRIEPVNLVLDILLPFLRATQLLQLFVGCFADMPMVLFVGSSRSFIVRHFIGSRQQLLLVLP